MADKHNIPKGKMQLQALTRPHSMQINTETQHDESKTQQRHGQGHLIQAYIPPLSSCKDTGEDPSFLHNKMHAKHTHAT